MSTTKRDAICEAALALFAEKGTEATTTREITEHAGTAEDNLYRHFKGKDDLTRCLFEQSADRFHKTLTHRVADLADPEERLQALVRGIFDFAHEHPSSFSFLLTTHHTSVLEERNASQLPPPARLFKETLEVGIAAGIFRQLDPLLATGWIVSMAQRAVVLLQTDLLDTPRSQVIHETVKASLRLVKAPSR